MKRNNTQLFRHKTNFLVEDEHQNSMNSTNLMALYNELVKFSNLDCSIILALGKQIKKSKPKKLTIESVHHNKQHSKFKQPILSKKLKKMEDKIRIDEISEETITSEHILQEDNSIINNQEKNSKEIFGENENTSFLVNIPEEKEEQNIIFLSDQEQLSLINNSKKSSKVKKRANNKNTVQIENNEDNCNYVFLTSEYIESDSDTDQDKNYCNYKRKKPLNVNISQRIKRIQRVEQTTITNYNSYIDDFVFFPSTIRTKQTKQHTQNKTKDSKKTLRKIRKSKKQKQFQVQKKKNLELSSNFNNLHVNFYDRIKQSHQENAKLKGENQNPLIITSCTPLFDLVNKQDSKQIEIPQEISQIKNEAEII